MRAAGEIDMAKQRWIENPEPLIKSILAIIKTSEEGAHRKEYTKTIQRAKKAADEFVKAVELKHGKVKGKIVKKQLSGNKDSYIKLGVDLAKKILNDN